MANYFNNKKRRLIIAIDYDGTLRKGQRIDDRDDSLREGAAGAIFKLWMKGCRLILWTCREGKNLKQAISNLRKKGIWYCFECANENVASLQKIFKSDQRKIYADYYIDDLNLRGFPGWDVVLEIIKRDPYFDDKDFYSMEMEGRDID